MKLYLTALSFTLLIAFCSTATAQKVHLDPVFNEAAAAFDRKIHSIHDFVKRFNGRDTLNGSTMDKMAYLEDRRMAIYSLLDREKVLAADSISKETIKAFVEEVCATSSEGYIELASDDWFAEAVFVTKYRGKEDTIRVFMVKEHENDWSKWSIRNVHSPLFAIKAADTSVFISPTGAELKFSELVGVNTKKKVPVASYAHKDVRYDPFSAFLFALESGDLELLYANRVILHFPDFNGWLVTVEEVNRTSENSGWLISDVRRITSKEQYMSSYFQN